MAARRPTRRSRRPFRVPPRSLPPSPLPLPSVHTRGPLRPLHSWSTGVGMEVGPHYLSTPSTFPSLPFTKSTDTAADRLTTILRYYAACVPSVRSPIPPLIWQRFLRANSLPAPCERVGRSRRCSIAQETPTSGHSLKKGASSDAVRAFSFRLRRCFHVSFHFIFI